MVVPGVIAIDAPGADAVAVSDTLRRLARRPGAVRGAARRPPRRRSQVVSGAVGRPALGGNLLVFDIDGRIEAVDLTTGVRTMLRREARAQLRGPSVLDDRLAYVKATYRRQQVMIGPLRPQRPASDTTLYGTTPTARRDAGHEPGRFPARGHINQPLWARPPAGCHGHADHDRDERRRRLRDPRAQARGPTAGAVVLRVDRGSARRGS